MVRGSRSNPEPVTWTRVEDLRAQVRKLWDRGELLASMLDPEPYFPKRLAFKRPGSQELSERFVEVRSWIATLRNASGFRIESKTIKHHVLGENAVPASAWVDSLDAAAKITGKQKEVQEFAAMITRTEARNPALLVWLAKQPLKALALAPVWEGLLDVIDWLKAHPRPGIYIREVDIPGVHSKFIESHRGVLGALLDLSLSGTAIDETYRGASQFESRFGFRQKPVRLRFRILDPEIALIPGSDFDITLTPRDFSCVLTEPRIREKLQRIFITENEINFLTFPKIRNSLVLFGAGYGFDALSGLSPLKEFQIYYWGDIDTHGFAILDQFRANVPHAKSLLMDETTLLSHRAFWEEERQPESRALSRLEHAERCLYEDLVANRFGNRVRLEQEKIGFKWLNEALTRIE